MASNGGEALANKVFTILYVMLSPFDFLEDGLLLWFLLLAILSSPVHSD